MSTATTKLGISKPDPAEVVDVLDDLGVQFDKIDTATGVTWVADGGTPSFIYHGLHIKELTSEKEFIYKNDGVGGFIKVATGAGKQTWTNMPLSANFAAQALYAVPQYRILDGFCQLRGVIRYTAGYFAANTVVIVAPGMPAPNGVGDNGARCFIPVSIGDTAGVAPSYNSGITGVLNPRQDGGIRFYGNTTASIGNLIHLDGASYSVLP